LQSIEEENFKNKVFFQIEKVNLKSAATQNECQGALGVKEQAS